MAVKSSFWSSPLLHLLLRLIGLVGSALAIVGCFLWLVLDRNVLGISLLGAGSAAVALAIGYELKVLGQGISSRRGAFGMNVFVQIALAVGVVVIANVVSFMPKAPR